jgi:hypothetical protein
MTRYRHMFTSKIPRYTSVQSKVHSLYDSMNMYICLVLNRIDLRSSFGATFRQEGGPHSPTVKWENKCSLPLSGIQSCPSNLYLVSILTVTQCIIKFIKSSRVKSRVRWLKMTEIPGTIFILDITFLMTGTNIVPEMSSHF